MEEVIQDLAVSMIRPETARIVRRRHADLA